MLARASEIGATRALEKLNMLKPTVSLSEAVEVYGRGTVERWIKDGVVRRSQTDRGRVLLDRQELLRAATLRESA